jgi:hypothetical protein
MESENASKPSTPKEEERIAEQKLEQMLASQQPTEGQEEAEGAVKACFTR